MSKLQRKHHQKVARILTDANQMLRVTPGMSAQQMRLTIAFDLEQWLASEDPTFDVRRFRQEAQLPQDAETKQSEMCPMARWQSTFQRPTPCRGEVAYRRPANPDIPPFWSCDEHAPPDDN